MKVHATKYFPFVFLIASCFGCGPRTTGVSGVVTIDGEPAENLTVLFQASTKAPCVPQAAYGITNVKGEYILSLSERKKKGVIPGEYAVFIAWLDPNPPPDETRSNPSPYKIPEEAVRGFLRYTVEETGDQKADFHLVNTKP